MSDLPKKITLREEGPREGFQIESRIVPSEDKVRLIEALAETGLKEIQFGSFVDPKRVPNMADSDIVAGMIKHKPGVRYTGIWLNMRGLERAVQTSVDLVGNIQMSASETFSIRNTNRDGAATLDEQRKALQFYKDHGIELECAYVMTAFGCNFEGTITAERVRDCVRSLMDVAAEFDLKIPSVRFADTVGWAAPKQIARVLGLVRETWPGQALGLHLHDTRGTGLANALEGLRMGVGHFDAAVAGLGGCPFAGHKGAAGNICTEDFVFLCEELGIETGVDLDKLIECARLAEEILGRPLPGKIMHSGSLKGYRHAA